MHSAWDRNFDLLVDHMSGHNQAFPSGPDNACARWIYAQRAAYRAGQLEDKRTARLEALPGWVWNTHEQVWNAQYELLELHLGTHYGAFPTKSDGIGAWISAQRTAYRRGSLSQKRIERLEALPGWQWKPLERGWEARFGEVARFLTAHDGNYPRDNSMATWISRQRNRYRASELDSGRAAQLETLPGWTWSLHEQAWDARFAELRDYLVHHSGAYPPSPGRVGRWLVDQRLSLKAGKLTAERIARLDSLPGNWRGPGRYSVPAAMVSHFQNAGYASFSDLAKAANLSVDAAIACLCNAKRRPSNRTMRKIAGALGIPSSVVSDLRHELERRQRHNHVTTKPMGKANSTANDGDPTLL